MKEVALTRVHVRACVYIVFAVQICEAFNANRYPFPEDPARQRQMHGEVSRIAAVCCARTAGCCLLFHFKAESLERLGWAVCMRALPPQVQEGGTRCW